MSPSTAPRGTSSADEFVANGERELGARARDRRSGAPSASPRPTLHLLPDDLDGLDAIELGCGTGYVSAWLARRGARPVGIDNSPKQLETATRLQREHGLDFPLLLGNAERVPSPTPRSTTRSASTAPRCGPTRTPGSPRPPACSGPAAG